MSARDAQYISGCNYYSTEFNFTYLIFESDGLTLEENVSLQIGENHLSLAKEKVSLNKIYTRRQNICYKISTTRKADFRKTEIRLKTFETKILETTEFIFTSEENSYGVTDNKFMDGKAFTTQLKGGNVKEIYLSVEKTMNLACNKESFFEYISSSLSESNFENCTNSCLRTSLPNEHYPICSNYEDWYHNVLKGNLTELEYDCNWGIIRDQIEDIIIEEKHLKTCNTIDYTGKIMNEKNDHDSNEVGIQYKFSIPLRSKVYQEFLISDAIDLVGSVGGTLGLFIGFSFSNITTFIIACIGTFLVSRNKLSKALLTSIEWVIYASLLASSIWFAWGVLDKYFKQDVGIKQYEGKVEKHPTIVICIDSWKYATDFYITYKIYPSDKYSVEDEVFLATGKNVLENFGETVNLGRIYTRYYGLCYDIKTTRQVDERKTVIEIWPSSSPYNLPESIPLIFTSEMNSYGVTQSDWRDGEGFSFITSGGNEKEIVLTVEKNVNLKCSDQSFYEFVASRLSEENFKKCNDACLMTSLPNDPYTICQNFDEWYGNHTNGKESNCNWHILRDLIQNITVDEEHLKTCATTQYLGKITFDKERTYKYSRILYKFSLPLKAKVYEEYLITDGITLIGSVGGTLSLFIGFSISNVVYSIVDFFKSTLETHFSGNFNNKE